MAAFVWGDGGAQMTPEQIAAQRKIAAAMMERGMDYSPVQAWSQGASRIAQGVLGGFESRQADEATKANSAAEAQLLASLMPGGAAPAAAGPVAAAPAVVDPAVAAPAVAAVAPTRSIAPGKVYSNDEPSPLDPPSGRDRDLAIRTVVGEAADQGPKGMQAVANVIRNRAVNGGYGGDTPSGVVMAPNQFEPWNGGPARARMLALQPTDPRYQEAGRAVDAAYTGDDPTNGAKNFIQPTLQTAMGRSMPAWAKAPGVMIGDHKFIGGAPQDPAQQPYQVAGPAVAAPQDPAALPPAAAPTQGYAIPGQPSPGVQAVAQAQSGVNPKLVAAMASPYVSEGTKKVLGILLQNQMANEAVQHVDAGNKILVMDKRGNVIKELAKGEPNKGPEYGVLRKDEFGNEVYGWRDSRDKSISETPKPAAAVAAPTADGSAPVVPPTPPGVDPKVWRETFSKNAATGATPSSFDDTSKMRHELNQLPSYKNIAQAAPIYKSMHEAAGRNTKAADLNMVYGLGKMMDPTSVVREGELEMANAAQGVKERLNGLIAQINSEGALTPAGREALMAEAHSRMQSYKMMYDQDAERYRGIATRNRANPEDVVHDFGKFEPWTVPKAAPAAPAQIDDLVKKYGPK